MALLGTKMALLRAKMAKPGQKWAFFRQKGPKMTQNGHFQGCTFTGTRGGTQAAYAEGVLLLERVGGTQVGEIPGTGGDRARAERCTFTGTRGGTKVQGTPNPWNAGRSSEGREL